MDYNCGMNSLLMAKLAYDLGWTRAFDDAGLLSKDAAVNLGETFNKVWNFFGSVGGGGGQRAQRASQAFKEWQKLRPPVNTAVRFGRKSEPGAQRIFNAITS